MCACGECKEADFLYYFFFPFLTAGTHLTVRGNSSQSVEKCTRVGLRSPHWEQVGTEKSSLFEYPCIPTPGNLKHTSCLYCCNNVRGISEGKLQSLWNCIVK